MKRLQRRLALEMLKRAASVIKTNLLSNYPKNVTKEIYQKATNHR